MHTKKIALLLLLVLFTSPAFAVEWVFTSFTPSEPVELIETPFTDGGAVEWEFGECETQGYSFSPFGNLVDESIIDHTDKPFDVLAQCPGGVCPLPSRTYSTVPLNVPRTIPVTINQSPNIVSGPVITSGVEGLRQHVIEHARTASPQELQSMHDGAHGGPALFNDQSFGSHSQFSTYASGPVCTTSSRYGQPVVYSSNGYYGGPLRVVCRRLVRRFR